MTQSKRISWLIAGALVLNLCVITLPAGAASMEDIVAVLGKSHNVEWTKALAARLKQLEEGGRIASASYATALRAFKGQRINGTPDEAATLILEVVVRVDRQLRRGASPGKVVLDARRAVATLEAHEGTYREDAQRRLRRQLETMGPFIDRELQRRAGPQNGPGGHNGAGVGPAGGGSQGGAGPAGGGNGETPSGS